jgi:S1-C subfamily serine protease
VVAWPDDEPEEEGPSGPPLPPDDRLWRHPSEIASGRHLAPTATLGRPRRRLFSRPPSWWYVLAAFAGGSALTVAGLALAGVFDDESPGRQAVERVATPNGNGDPDQVAEAVMAATVHLTITTSEGTRDGSGLLFRDDGYILTTADLVAEAETISAIMGDGSRFTAALTGADPSTDLAVVNVVNPESPTWPSAVLGSSSDVGVGERVLAVGSPTSATSAALATETVIRATGLRLDTERGALYDLLLASGGETALPPGSALVDQQGAVVGLVTARDGTIQPDPGLPGAFAIPMQHARRIADQLVEGGRALHAWMGATTEQDARGAQVTAVAEGSPAEAAGLEVGDVITTIAGTPVGSSTQVAVALLDHLPGDKIRVMYMRDGDVREAEVELAERPVT